MRIRVLTLFPEMFDGPLRSSILGRAAKCYRHCMQSDSNGVPYFVRLCRGEPHREHSAITRFRLCLRLTPCLFHVDSHYGIVQAGCVCNCRDS